MKEKHVIIVGVICCIPFLGLKADTDAHLSHIEAEKLYEATNLLVQLPSSRERGEQAVELLNRLPAGLGYTSLNGATNIIRWKTSEALKEIIAADFQVEWNDHIKWEESPEKFYAKLEKLKSGNTKSEKVILLLFSIGLFLLSIIVTAVTFYYRQSQQNKP